VLQKLSRSTLPPGGGAKARLPGGILGPFMRLFVSVTAGALLSLMSQATWAQSAADISPDPAFSSGFKFAEQSGENLFKSVCQACHMPNGEGATGAGSYPPLAADQALSDHGYPVSVVVFGKRAMPPFGDMMTNDQVAAVVNYLRTHFDNSYLDKITAEEVQAIRP
jgi:mono/diheme cytochrome c family protein